MNLTYEAIDGSGRSVADMVEAPSIREAVDGLRKSGLFVTHIARAREEDAPRRMAAAGQELARVRFSSRELVFFTRQMAMLLTAGSAMVPALSALTRQMRRPMHVALLRQVIADLEEGFPLAEALRKYPLIFDASYCAVVAAGEASATLPQMFAKLAAIVGKRRAMRNKVLGAMAYPALLIVLCTSILNVLLFFVIPRFGDMFTTLDVPLPWSTEIMLNVSMGLQAWWPVPVSFVFVTAGLVAFAVKSPRGRQFISDAQIRIPLAGRILSRLIQAQMVRILGMLIEAKVGLLEALDLARGVTSNRQYAALCDSLEEAVTAGNSMSGAMEKSGLIDPGICQAVRTGEESGSLGQSISYVADVLDEENTELLAVATKLVEPLILIVMGVVVGIVAISLFMPLFDVTAAVK